MTTIMKAVGSKWTQHKANTRGATLQKDQDPDTVVVVSSSEGRCSEWVDAAPCLFNKCALCDSLLLLLSVHCVIPCLCNEVCTV